MSTDARAIEAGVPREQLAAWKSALSLIAAILLFLIFLVPGLWKTLFPIEWAVRLQQLQVPGPLAVPGTIVLGIAELFAAVLIIVPRYRRWGAWLSGGLLVVFMAYIGYYYDVLRGEECSCFPWLKRSVGPAFFISDAAMVALAAIAGVWARPSTGMRSAVRVLAGITVFALAVYGMTVMRASGIEAPASVTVNGQPYSLQEGRIFLYFFNPECSHCDEAARDLAKLDWVDTRIISIPTANPQFAEEFVRDTGLPGVITEDIDLLRKTFSFTDPPYAVLLEDGRQRAAFIQFDQTQPAASLRSLGAVR